MPTMIVKTSVEATPELVAELLAKNSAATANSQFPFPAQSFVTLTPDVLSAIGGVPGMPSLVMMTGRGSPLGVVAIYKTDGEITVAYVSELQVVEAWSPPAQEPASEGPAPTA